MSDALQNFKRERPVRSLAADRPCPPKISRFCCVVFLFVFCLNSYGQEPWTWDKVKEHFQANNPSLLADRLNIDESKAQ